MSAVEIRIKRIYDEYSQDDGKRILVDRIWPRGMTKSDARIDLWLKEIAPSNELRKWFDHDRDKWDDFKVAYFRELEGHNHSLEQLLDPGSGDRITLLYSARDREYNQAVVLKEYIYKIKNDPGDHKDI